MSALPHQVSANAAGASAAPAAGGRLPLVDALRAIACTVIAWHHFQHYWPLSPEAAKLTEKTVHWLEEYGKATPIFFVVGGFVTAMTTARVRWNLPQAGRFVAARYCRLALPYLAAIGMAIVAANIARGTLSDKIVGPPATWPQFLAHVFFLQDILNDNVPLLNEYLHLDLQEDAFASLSAGLWYVCVDFQMLLIWAALLLVRDMLGPRDARKKESGPRFDAPLWLGAALALASLLYFNMLGWPPREDAPDADEAGWVIWGTYFFHYFFLGYLVHRALQDRRFIAPMWAFAALSFAMSFVEGWLFDAWGWRLAMGASTAAILFLGGKYHFLTTWPRSRLVAAMGRTSYSFFLIHYSWLLVLAYIWRRQEWDTTQPGAWACVVATYIASLLATAVFYPLVEKPAARVGKWVSSRGR